MAPPRSNISARTIARLVRQELLVEGNSAFARRCGIDEGTIRKICDPNHNYGVSFDVADKIIQHGLNQPELWHTEPELSAVYEGSS
jgi:hypothetical protein